MKITLLKIKKQLVGAEGFKHLAKMINVVMRRLAKHQDVIKIHNSESTNERLQYVIHKAHERT